MAIDTSDLDMEPRYAPTELLTLCDAGPRHDRQIRRLPVIGWTLHPPRTDGGTHGGCIKGEYFGLECRTEYGSRWFGVAGGGINSELRMVVWGVSKRDEVRMQWPIVPLDRRI